MGPNKVLYPWNDAPSGWRWDVRRQVQAIKGFMPVKYEHPPINEVVCGMRFGQLPELDAVRLGFYAQERRENYPNHQVLPPIGGVGGLTIGSGAFPIRVWLVSEDDEFVVQMQADRFYVNWRARGGKYPKFSGENGILPKLKKEAALFWEFCERSVGKRPELQAIELAKIDVLPEGDYWDGLDDLGTVVPWIAGVLGSSQSEKPLVAIRVVEPRNEGKLSVNCDLGIQTDGKGTGVRVLKIETRLEHAVTGEVESAFRAFEAANAEVNSMFETVIPADVAARRFNP